MRIEAEVRIITHVRSRYKEAVIFATAYCDDGELLPWHPPWKGPERRGLSWAKRDLQDHVKEFHEVQLSLLDQEIQ